MENLEVERMSADRLSRKIWHFHWYSKKLVLHRYCEETRQTTRHKFTGPKWESIDERSYHSKLDRPPEIPGDVMMDAIAKIAHSNFHFYIGWSNDESYHATKHVTDY